jgi:hypothetical protein
MPPEISRRLLSGIWRTTQREEDDDGGSLPSGGNTGEVLAKQSNADGDVGWDPSGGSLPEPFNYYGTGTSGDPPISFDGTPAPLPWALSNPTFYPGQGSQPFNLTDPLVPVVTVAGNYTFACEVGTFGGAHAGKYLEGILYLDTDGIFDGPAQLQEMGAAVTICSFGCRRYLAVGTKIQLWAAHDVGSNIDVFNWIQISREAT